MFEGFVQGLSCADASEPASCSPLLLFPLPLSVYLRLGSASSVLITAAVHTTQQQSPVDRGPSVL